MARFAIYNPISFLQRRDYLEWEAARLDAQILFATDSISIVTERDAAFLTPPRITIYDAKIDRAITSNINPIDTIAYGQSKFFLHQLNMAAYVGKYIYISVFVSGEAKSFVYSRVLYISDGSDIRENTVTLSAYNTHNRNGVYQFESNTAQSSITLPAGVQAYPEATANNEFYEMSFGRNYPLNTENFLVYEYNFGGKFGLPPHVANAIYTLLCCDWVYINNERHYLRELPEITRIEGHHNVGVKAKFAKDTSPAVADLGNNDKPIVDLPRVPLGDDYTYINTEGADKLITEAGDNIITGTGQK
jgi:hypothetical protein